MSNKCNLPKCDVFLKKNQKKYCCREHNYKHLRQGRAEMRAAGITTFNYGRSSDDKYSKIDNLTEKLLEKDLEKIR